MPTVSIPLDTDEAFAQITGGVDLTPAPPPVPQLTDWQLKAAEKYMITPEQIAKLYDVPVDLIAYKKPIDFTATIATDQPTAYDKLVKMLVQDASNPECDPTIVSAELLAGLGLDDPEQRRKTAWLFQTADRVLARDGWCQNVLHQRYQEMTIGAELEFQPVTKHKHCTLGAFVMAVTGRMTDHLEPNSAQEREYNRMALFLSHSLGGTPVPAWNDHPARKAHDVHRALQTCQRYLLSV